MAEVLLRNVKKIYENGFQAVKDIDLKINDGELMVLVGPSGCAKSTTLRMIAGLETISEGKILIGEKIINDILPKNRQIAMVFQNYALYPHMNVYDNMSFSLKLQNYKKTEIKKRVYNIAEKLEITDLLQRKPKELSGGQKQRVALGRAIIREPEVFLLDEPLSNLDAKLRLAMRVRIVELQKELKTTMIYVTHDQVEAMTMGDRICVMNDGKIMQVDTPINIYRYPKCKFVAEFIGSPSMNLVEAIVEAEDVLSVKEHKIFLSKEKTTLLKDYLGRKIWLGLRPENIMLCESENMNNKKNILLGTVKIKEQMGSDTHIYFEIDKSCQWVARVSAKQATQVNLFEKRHFLLDVNELHFFEKETEKAI